jgi:hypothetical protein
VEVGWFAVCGCWVERIGGRSDMLGFGVTDWRDRRNLRTDLSNHGTLKPMGLSALSIPLRCRIGLLDEVLGPGIWLRCRV